MSKSSSRLIGLIVVVAVLTLICVVIALVLGLCGMTNRATPAEKNSPEGQAKNIAYFKKTLGPIVLNHRAANGEVFEDFGQAYSASGVTLMHRGDYYGDGFTYHKLGPDSFLFYGLGADAGWDSDDDIIVIYRDGIWSIMGRDEAQAILQP